MSARATPLDSFSMRRSAPGLSALVGKDEELKERKKRAEGGSLYRWISI